jgi:hypothetical protein
MSQPLFTLKSYQLINSTVGTTGGVSAFTINAAGTNYVIGDFITFTAGAGTCVIQVVTVGAGGDVLTYKIISAGSGYSVAVTVINTTTNSVAGAGFTAVITAVAISTTAVALSTAIPLTVINRTYTVVRPGTTSLAMGGTCVVAKAEVQALYSNTGFVAIGDAPVPFDGTNYSALTNGVQLAAGQTVVLEDVDLYLVKMLPRVNNEGVIITVYIRTTK